MEQPKFEVGQEVEAKWNHAMGHMPATVVKIKYLYTVKFANYALADLEEADIKLPKPSPEEAWEKAAMLVGQRAYIKGKPTLPPIGYHTDFNRETRHQVYQILGSASIKITDEVKRDVRRLIEVADSL